MAAKTKHNRLESFIFFNDTATTEIYTLSLHDALPIAITCNLTHLPRYHSISMLAGRHDPGEVFWPSSSHSKARKAPRSPGLPIWWHRIWIASVPGFVKISMRPKPGRSYSGEKGLELIRISRIEAFDGRLPPVKPSM